MKLFINLSFFVLVLGSSMFENCRGEDPDPNCYPSSCETYSYSIIDAETFENLVGTHDQPFHPNDILILTDELDTMPFGIGYSERLDWWTFDFSYYDEVMRCDLHKTDSILTLTYLIRLSEADWDTLDIIIEPCADFSQILFNGNNNVFKPDSFQEGISSLFLRK